MVIVLVHVCGAAYSGPRVTACTKCTKTLRIFRHSACILQVLTLQESPHVNKDQVKGKATDIAGKAQEKLGDITGSEEQQAKGLAKQVKGKAQKGFGDAKEAVKDAADDARDTDKPH
jgi:uncharacterized protein YjbJ (UPF0337 family)